MKRNKLDKFGKCVEQKKPDKGILPRDLISMKSKNRQS